MVAYSFAPQFEDPILAGLKDQTVRGNRKRHARVGEPMQLYTGMRTKHCRKIMSPDPICAVVIPILIEVDATFSEIISSIELGGHALPDDTIESFAIRDGFVQDADSSARRCMGQFWLKHHSTKQPWFDFDGVVLRWRTA